MSEGKDKIFIDLAQKLNTENFLDKGTHAKEIVKLYQQALFIITSSYDEYRKYISRILYTLEQNDRRALAYSQYIFDGLIAKLKEKDVKPMDLSAIEVSCPRDVFDRYLIEYEKAIEKNNRPRFSEFTEFDKTRFSDIEKKQVMSRIVSIVEEKSKIVEFSSDDVGVVTMLLVVFRQFSVCTKSEPLFYFMAGQFLDRLNTSELYQTARDSSEEILLCSFQDSLEYMGFYETFLCYAGQSNTHAAIFYANLSLYSYVSKSSFIYDKFRVQFLTTAIKYFRNIDQFDEAIKLYKNSEGLKLSDYDRHFLDHLYFTCLLQDRRKSLPIELLRYLRVEFQLISKGDSHDATPWVTLLYNLKKIYPLFFNEGSEMHNFLQTLELKVPQAVREKITSILFGSAKDLKDILKSSLIKLNQTNFLTDLYYDNDRAISVASQLATKSIEEKDAEGILLAMLIKSDFSLIFQPRESQGMVEMRVPQIDQEQFDKLFPSVLTSVLNLSKINPSKQFTWLAFSEGRVFQMSLRNGVFRFFKLVKWDWSTFKTLESADYFHSLKFEDTLRDHSGVYQTTPEEYACQSEEIAREIDFSRIFSDPDAEAHYLVKDMQLSQFPHGLLRVSGSNFLALTGPITNILSTEWYLKNIEGQSRHKQSHAIWIPTESGDTTINKLFSNIEETLRLRKFTVFTQMTPVNPLSEVINIVCSHGAKDIAQKQVVYPADMPVFDLEKHFGKGQVLIFFVCHSGSYKNDFLRNNISSIVKTFINKGYQAVIAPFWALHIDVAGIWLPTFLDELARGITIDKAVFSANTRVKEKYPHPAAWAAMHLYGNPELTFTT